MRSGVPDVLGPEYEAITLPMGADSEGEVVATLVRHRQLPATRAVLHLHGYSDYFFQRHMADFYVRRGFDFYALDLRKYGRSLRPYQTPNYCRSLSDYFPEIDEAVRIIREEDGHDTLLLSAHSTGGLIAALWADRARGRDLIDGMFLNSPFFDLPIPGLLRSVSGPLTRTIAAARPLAPLVPAKRSYYAESLHRDHHGEWDFDLTWKPVDALPVRAGWLSAVRRGQRRLHAGLAIDVPILVMCSTRAVHAKAFTPELHRGDGVLNPDHIARWSTRLGPRVTCLRIDDALHDVTLSSLRVREVVCTELDGWLRTHVKVTRDET